MYEAEVNSSFESIETLPVEIRRHFEEFRDCIEARTTLPWGEHCTECNWPTCYSTCELYDPRADGACRQFVDGMVRIDHRQGVNPYLLKMQFKRWAKLWTVGNLDLQTPAAATRKEKLNMAVGAIGRTLPLPRPVKVRVLGKINYLRRTAVEKVKERGEPDCFVMECYNPNSRTISLTFTVRLRERSEPGFFQSMLTAPTGFTRSRVAFSDISRGVDISQPFEVEIVPNDSNGVILYFGLIDFVKERRVVGVQEALRPDAQKWKCIVWDLDNTLWDGVLVEDGPEKIRVRQAAVDVIRETDKRGILHSVASKNNPDEAVKMLKEFGLSEYFLYPQIAWRPKSHSIARIAQLLNIGADTIAFVDDQAFEREEVRSALPQVAVLDANEYHTIPIRSECNIVATEESSRRRLMYRDQEQRDSAQKSFKGDYLGFLREAKICVRLHSLTEQNLTRVYELAQRTNQLNFSGNRYPREHLAEIMATEFLETCVIECVDRFGSYGIVGFAVIDTREPRLLDLMFSCRIQGKRVEHAVLTFLLKRFVESRGADFAANYRRTEKNAPGGRVFEEMDFDCLEEKEGMSSLVFRRGRKIPDDKIIELSESEN
jgi:FkbH-like protein